MLVGKHFLQNGSYDFSETSHEVGCFKGKKLMQPDFWEKSYFGNNAPKIPKNSFFGDFAKKNPLMVDFFGLNLASCTIITFLILVRLHVGEGKICIQKLTQKCSWLVRFQDF